MGKSNKFDYTNRGSSGKRLGEIIGSAVKKESEKVKKDAERHAQKARKQSSSSSEPQEATGTTHFLDLRAPLKELGDDGVAALANGLEEALLSGTATASLALEMFNLSGNGITVMSLARLAPVIELGRFDLKVLDLANNAIKVETDEESVLWEKFLCAFRGCRRMEHLDLSHNQGIGPRALEIFARVYMKEHCVHVSPAADHPAYRAPNDDGYFSGDGEKSTSLTERSDSLHAGKTSGTRPNEYQGLRSIPYISLADISLREFEALWLSYIITEHLYPVQLFSDMQERQSEEGIDWSMHALGRDGLNLLKRAEEQRRTLLLGPDEDTSDAFSLIPLLEITNIASGSGQKVGKRRAITHAPLPGIKSSRTAGSDEFDHSELDSLRRKFQRQLIESAPPVGKVELWAAALELFLTSRKVFCLASPRVHKETKMPLKVVQRIADFAMEGRRLDLMTKRQKGVVIARGLNRQSLAEEREWARKGASTQVWMLLDQIECLAYEEEGASQ